jgi:fibronectin-binding autotransporter adhesin
MAINKDFIIPDSGLQVNGASVLSSTLGVSGAVTVTNTLAVGNTTVTGNVNVSVAANVGGAIRAGGLITGVAGADITGTANASVAINVGANVNLSVSAINVGNSSSNTVVTQTSVNTGNSTLFTTIGQATGLFGNSSVNTAIGQATVNLGNTTVNTQITSSSFRTGNGSAYTNVTATALTTNGTLSVTGAATFSNSVTVAGDFTVSGTTTFVNTATLNVSDNIIALNTDVAGAPSENAGVEVNRGTSSNVSLIWNESTDRWQISSSTTTFGNIHSTLADIALGTHTSGDYVASITSGSGLSGGASGEGSTPTLVVGAGNGIAVDADSIRVVAGTGVTSNASGVHIGQPVGTSSNVQFANVLITTAALGGTATNLVNTFTIQTNVGNESYLRFHTYRHTTGADWLSASSRIQQRIDATDQAYIEFNPISYLSGIGIFSQAGKGFVVDTNGITNYSANVSMANNHVISPSFKAYKEQVTAITVSSGSQALDLSTTNIFNLTLASSTTLSFSNPPAAGIAYTVTLHCKQDTTGSRTITFPASVKFPNNSTPVLSTQANKIDIFSLFTLDGGATYVGALALANVG